jgi:hypothetical protein
MTSPPPPPHPYAPRRTNGLAVASLVVSLVGLLACLLVGVIGLVLGYRARDQIRETGEEGEGLAKAGIIIGWIAVATDALIILCGIGVLATVWTTV